MTSEFDSACDTIMAAVYPADLFGGGTPEVRFRSFAKRVHPDRVDPAQVLTATAAFARLSDLWNRWNAGDIDSGSELESRKARYRAVRWASADNIGDLYTGRLHDLKISKDVPPTDDVVLRRANKPANNDLVAAEAASLKVLASKVPPQWKAYVPVLFDSFQIKDEHTGALHTTNVFPHVPGLVNLVTLKHLFPDGLDPRDVAWIWRRLLLTVSLAQDAGIVHGAVLPEHVLVDVVHHGLVLQNWCFSVRVGEVIKAVVPVYRRQGWYDSDGVLGKKPTTLGTDLDLVAKTMDWLMVKGPGNRPPAFNSFIHGSTAAFTRHEHALTLLNEFDELIAKLYGPRKFRPFPAIGNLPEWPK